MTVATLAFIGLSFTKPRTHRIFHYITALVTMVAAIAYFTMGSNLGFTPIQVEFSRSNPRVHGTYREIFYVRYIDWYTSYVPKPVHRLMLYSGLSPLRYYCWICSLLQVFHGQLFSTPLWLTKL